MGFEEKHPRNTDGKFSKKTGATAEVTLAESAYPAGFPVDGTNESKIEWAYVNGGVLTVEVDSGTRELSGPFLRAWWDGWRPGDRFNVIGAHLRGSAADGRTNIEMPSLTRSAATDLTKKLRAGDKSLDLSDIGELRRALDEAEYQAVADEADRFLRENYPDARAMVVSFDAFTSEPYIVGVETSEPKPGSGRNYGNIRPVDDGYDELGSFQAEYSHYLQRFENEGLFDEYGTVLIDSFSDYGEFVDPSGSDENSLGLQDSARVYRLSGRS